MHVHPLLSRIDLVLVETGNAENLGSIARLMANFDVASLSLVAPRVPADDHRALVVGRAALDRLRAARVAATLDEAVAGASYVVGLSARRGADRPTVDLLRLPALLAERAPAGRVALVFGPEDTGLRVEHIDRCDALASMALPGPLASLNLAQAAGIVLWELGRAGHSPPAPRGGATRAELEALLDHAFTALDAIDYFRGPAGERDQKRVHLRRVLAAAALTCDEIKGLHGLCAQVLSRHSTSTGKVPATAP